jgi:excinuclease UvrABC nuclease subunit
MKNSNWFITNTYDVVPYCTPPALAGCYAIYGLNYLTGEKRLIYIGTSKNLQKRIPQHNTNNYLVSDIKKGIYEIPLFKIKLISNTNKRLETEQRLIKRLKPFYNKQYTR